MAEGGSDAEIGSDVMEGMEESEDWAAGGYGIGGQVEFATQEFAKGGNAGSWPRRDIGDGAVFDFTVLTEGFAKEDGGRGVAVGDGLDLHGCALYEA